ncbi:glycosyltransferase family 4 protein [Lysobacter sp. A3-1-A15]|uniref:glycosyltransferase family 4 protein n=1 Tax=Novilysobacter viscosus TaxID=3098602 RepID=UPI002ED8B21C
MHYAIVTETYPPQVNGVALTVQAFEQGLRGRGHRVDVVRPRLPGESDAAPGTLLMAGLPLPVYDGLRFGLPATGRLRRHWDTERPDAVYIATEGPLGWSALRGARSLGIPVATGLHTRFDRYMRAYGLGRLGRLDQVAWAWMRRFHDRGDATLVPTRELAAELAAHGFKRPVRLPRAVDTRRFSPDHRDAALREHWGVGGDRLAVIHVGRIAAEKNLALVVRAFRAIQRVRPDARLVWIGDGPARDALQREHPDFLFPGMQHGHALAAHVASGDLFLFPSRSETFGNVTLEAMASGVATVAYDCGAAREHLRHGLHGGCVAPGDEASFIDAAVYLASDDRVRAACASAARRAVAALRPAQVAADLDGLLQGLAHRGGRHGSPAAA